MPVLAPTRDQTFLYGDSDTPPPFSRLLRSRWGYGGAHSRLNPPGPHGGQVAQQPAQMQHIQQPVHQPQVQQPQQHYIPPQVQQPQQPPVPQQPPQIPPPDFHDQPRYNRDFQNRWENQHGGIHDLQPRGNRGGGARLNYIGNRERVENLPKGLRYNGSENWNAFRAWKDGTARDYLCWSLEGKASEYFSTILERDPDIGFF